MESVVQMVSGKVLMVVVICALIAVMRQGAWAFELDLRSAYPAFSEAVLFPFDRDCVPFRHALQTQLMKSKWDGRGPVISPGPKGTPDCDGISYYGTVIQTDDKIRLWYLASGEAEGEPDRLRICYAESEDGMHFTKPKLGLVSYGGNKENNVVDTGLTDSARACVILHEPDDPNPDRRYKLFAEANQFRGCVAFSRDGLKWTPSSNNPVTVTPFEPTGLVKRDGCYYVIGQTAGERGGFRKRVLCALASYDFEHWTTATTMGFRRDDISPRPVRKGYNMGKQVHLGAGLWDRGSVVLGLYGQWDGADDDDDRRYLKMNLGLVVTHDGLKFEEPIPDFQMIRNIEEGWTDDRPMGYPPRLAQGQGMAQVGDKTLAYYSHWGRGGSHQIWIAAWDRDRLGFCSPTTDPDEGQWMTDTCHPHLISCPVQIGPRGASIHLNASNLSELGYLTVEVLDRQFRPVSGYTADEAKPIKGGGFEVEARWNKRDTVEGTDGPIRIKVNWHGARSEDPRLYAIYVRSR